MWDSQTESNLAPIKIPITGNIGVLSKKATSRFLSHFGWFNAHHLEANNLMANSNWKHTNTWSILISQRCTLMYIHFTRVFQKSTQKCSFMFTWDIRYESREKLIDSQPFLQLWPQRTQNCLADDMQKFVENGISNLWSEWILQTSRVSAHTTETFTKE